MTLDALLATPPPWLSADVPHAAFALWSSCALSRNFADFPFPARCSPEEKQLVEQRVLAALDSLNLLHSGSYYSLESLSPRQRQLLAERQYVTPALLAGHGPRGVYVSADKRFTILVNGEDHLCLRTLVPGLQLEEAWAQLNLADDTLNSGLDFAFDPKYGYLTSALDAVGTGLTVSVLLHLAASERVGGLSILALALEKNKVGLHGIVLSRPGELPEARIEERCLLSEANGVPHRDPVGTAGAWYLLVNARTLGLAEEELVFQLRQAAIGLVEEEKQARDRLMHDNRDALEDFVGRAHGLASNARLLEFPEGFEWLSALRLGVERGLETHHTIGSLNRLLLQSQSAHVAQAQNDGTQPLGAGRAALFREASAPPANA